MGGYILKNKNAIAFLSFNNENFHWKTLSYGRIKNLHNDITFNTMYYFF